MTDNLIPGQGASLKHMKEKGVDHEGAIGQGLDGSHLMEDNYSGETPTLTKDVIGAENTLLLFEDTQHNSGFVCYFFTLPHLTNTGTVSWNVRARELACFSKCQTWVCSTPDSQVCSTEIRNALHLKEGLGICFQ